MSAVILGMWIFTAAVWHTDYKPAFRLLLLSVVLISSMIFGFNQ